MAGEFPEGVNPHYLKHLRAVLASHQVVAARHVMVGNGIRLLVPGTPIDSDVLDRVLQHVLRTPLEECLQVTDGITAASFAPIGEALLERHPLLRALCKAFGAPAPESLAALPLSMPVQALLTVYLQSQPGRLDHIVGAAMLALSLARRILPGDVERHNALALAGLLHDVGELYMDPAHLQAQAPQAEDPWHHFLNHPRAGHKVLLDMEGAGPVVAKAVLQHHERMDGYGYPDAVAGSAFTLDGQIVAAADWLMALVEADAAPLTRARMACQLVPGEFSPAVLEAIATAARLAPDPLVELAKAPPLQDAVPRILRLAETLRRFHKSQDWLDERIALAGPRLRAVLEAGEQRMARIQASFSSTGLDAHSPAMLLAELDAMRDASIYMEIMTLVGELEWRMRELQRKQGGRAELLKPAERAVVEEWVARLKGARRAATPLAAPRSAASNQASASPSSVA
ncbi:MAG: HD domain-containing protein [Pseudomonadota bacterium]